MASNSEPDKGALPSASTHVPVQNDQPTVVPNPSSSTSGGPAAGGKKRKNHRAGKKKKTRRQSFAAMVEPPGPDAARSSHDLQSSAAQRTPFYKSGAGRNFSDTSLDSEALLDHRDHAPMRPRRDSRAALNTYDSGISYRPSYSNPLVSNDRQSRQQRQHRRSPRRQENEEDDVVSDARTPLLGQGNDRPSTGHGFGYGLFQSQSSRRRSNARRSNSNGTSVSSQRRRPLGRREHSNSAMPQDYDINNPPSVPPSPKFGPDQGLNDVMVTDPFDSQSPIERRATLPNLGEQLIDIDGDAAESPYRNSTPSTPKMLSTNDLRRHTMPLTAEGDVCFPVDGMSDMAEEDYYSLTQKGSDPVGPRRKRSRQWPDLSVLEDWSREEKEERSEVRRAKTISEPVLVGGRLRPQKSSGWHRAEEDAPYRFTYFNEELPSTIHSQTISELLQPGQSFRDLFIPDPPELSDESSDEEDLISHDVPDRRDMSPDRQSKIESRHASILDEPKSSSKEHSSAGTPMNGNPQQRYEKPKRYGPRPTFWLDVLSPTETEMKVIQKAFGIHPLTAEDILMQEAREKVELFRNYYFVNYRTFEQDVNSEEYLGPVDMYVVVFREGVISFHFSQSPHPANVRRRIRQLKDYLSLTADWISYAIIDDITDAFAPSIQSIENEVDEIDDAILQLHTHEESNGNNSKDKEKHSEAGELNKEPGGHMLHRIGRARKDVMGMYRLLGNKADVIKGFAKRCNEKWDVAPRSDIGMYLGDIQDHILTMTSNLSHYETLLSRAHSNYLAQINIRMNERQEQTADVLGKLTVLGTIVLPMNIITGMWGMNVLVPGQDTDNLYWFWSITAGLFMFGFVCFFIAKRVYGIV